jgi:hypothetical protein
MADSQEAPPPPIVPSLYSQNPQQTIDQLAVSLDTASLTSSYPKDHLEAISATWRLSMYLASAQIFLKSNSQVSEPLSKDDIKPRSVFSFSVPFPTSR